MAFRRLVIGRITLCVAAALLPDKGNADVLPALSQRLPEAREAGTHPRQPQIAETGKPTTGLPEASSPTTSARQEGLPPHLGPLRISCQRSTRYPRKPRSQGCCKKTHTPAKLTREACGGSLLQSIPQASLPPGSSSDRMKTTPCRAQAPDSLWPTCTPHGAPRALFPTAFASDAGQAS